MYINHDQAVTNLVHAASFVAIDIGTQILAFWIATDRIGGLVLIKLKSVESDRGFIMISIDLSVMIFADLPHIALPNLRIQLWKILGERFRENARM